MRYLSPFDLAEFGPETTTSTEDWKRVKRKWLAEFELTDEPTVTVSGNQVNKQDVLALLEETQDLQTMHFHRMVYRNRAVFQFLKGSSWHARWQFPKNWGENHAFKLWIGAWIAERMAEEIKKRIGNSANWQALSRMFDLGQLLLPKDYETAYRHFVEITSSALRIQFKDVVRHGSNMIPKLQFIAYLVSTLPDFYSPLKKQGIDVFLNLTLFFCAQRKFADANEFYQLIKEFPEHLIPQELFANLFRAIRQKDPSPIKQYVHAGMGFSVKPSPLSRTFLWVSITVGLIIFITILTNYKQPDMIVLGDMLTPDFGEMHSADTEAYANISNFWWWNEDWDTIPHDTFRPVTGTHPYLWILPNYPAIDTSRGKFLIENLTPFDGVVFLQTSTENYLTVYHVYLRSGESWKTPPLEAGFYQIRWYAGKHWWQDLSGKNYSRFKQVDMIPFYQNSMPTDRSWTKKELLAGNDSATFVIGLDMLQETYQESLH